MATLGKVPIEKRPGCPECGVVLETPSAGDVYRCPACHQAFGGPLVNGAPARLPCVACSSALRACRAAGGGLTIDFCPSCEGFWFDGAELESLVKAPDLIDTFPLPPRGERPLPVFPDRERGCVRCPEQPLKQTQLQDVLVDHCPRCRGSWLDAGELERLIELHNRPPERDSWLSQFVARALRLLAGR